MNKWGRPSFSDVEELESSYKRKLRWLSLLTILSMAACLATGIWIGRNFSPLVGNETDTTVEIEQEAIVLPEVAKSKPNDPNKIFTLYDLDTSNWPTSRPKVGSWDIEPTGLTPSTCIAYETSWFKQMKSCKLGVRANVKLLPVTFQICAEKCSENLKCQGFNYHERVCTSFHSIDKVYGGEGTAVIFKR